MRTVTTARGIRPVAVGLTVWRGVGEDGATLCRVSSNDPHKESADVTILEDGSSSTIAFPATNFQTTVEVIDGVPQLTDGQFCFEPITPWSEIEEP